MFSYLCFLIVLFSSTVFSFVDGVIVAISFNTATKKNLKRNVDVVVNEAASPTNVNYVRVRTKFYARRLQYFIFVNNSITHPSLKDA